jgi:hypothetical protein
VLIRNRYGKPSRGRARRYGVAFVIAFHKGKMFRWTPLSRQDLPSFQHRPVHLYADKMKIIRTGFAEAPSQIDFEVAVPRAEAHDLACICLTAVAAVGNVPTKNVGSESKPRAWSFGRWYFPAQ